MSTCTPTATGTFTINGKVTDATGAFVTSRTFKLTVVADPVITGFNATPTATDVGKSATLTVSASQGSGSFNYVYSGLPSGCSTSNTPSITCTPLVSGRATIIVTVTDSEGKYTTAALNLTIGATPTLSVTDSPSSINTGQSVTFTVTTTGGDNPFSFRYAGLPAGCSTTNAATLTCNPSAAGTFTITVTGTDQATSSAQGTAQLVVKSPTSTSFLGLPLVAGVGIVVVVLLVVVLAVALMMRRRKKPAARRRTGRRSAPPVRAKEPAPVGLISAPGQEDHAAHGTGGGAWCSAGRADRHRSYRDPSPGAMGQSRTTSRTSRPDFRSSATRSRC